MELISYITVNLLLFSSWYVLLFKIKSPLSFVDRVLGALILGLAQIVLTEMALGILFKKLFATPLFVLNISVSLSVLTFAVIKKKQVLIPQSGTKKNEEVIARSPETSGRRSNPFYLTELARDIFKEFKDKISDFISILKNDWILLSIFILFSISLCYLLFIGYLFPSYSWDALLSHLPTIGFILQSGTIENVPYNGLIYIFINVFPKNIDLFFLWNVIFLKSDVIVDLSQLLFTVAGMLAVYSIAVKLKIKEKYAVLSSLLFFFAPIIILQSTANYVDIAVSVLFLIAINFLTPYMSLRGRYDRSNLNDEILPLHYVQGQNDKSKQTCNDNIPILLAGITAGILLGSKGSGPLYIFALSILFFINEIRRFFSINRKKGSKQKCHCERSEAISPFSNEIATSRTIGTRNDRQHNRFRFQYRDFGFTVKKIIFRYTVYFLIPVILLGSYWYIQNWVYYGNPVYPMIVTIFGKTLFRGMLTELLHISDVIRNLSPVIRPLYVWLEKTEYYFYASETAGFGPMWFILFLPALVFSFFYAIWKRSYDFPLITLIMLFVFVLLPANWAPRYVIFIFGLGCLSFAFMLEYFEKREKVLLLPAPLFVLYSFITVNSLCITPKKIKEFILLSPQERTLAKMKPCFIDNTQREEYGLWSWVSNNVSAGDTLAYTFTPTLLGPLWNSSFSNKIVYVKAGNFNDWIKTLEANSVDYVLLLSKPRSMEEWWLTRLWELRNEPEWSKIYKKFRLEYSDSEYLVLKFKETEK